MPVPQAHTGEAGPPWLADALLAAIIVLFGMSGGMLWHLGYNYEGLSGSVASKIHPYTYLIVVIFVAAALSSGNPIGFASRAARARPASALLFISALLLVVHIALRGSSGLAGSIDTFVGAPLLLVLIAKIDERGLRRLEIALHVILTVNAIMAIGEFASKILVFPYRFDGAVFPTDKRSAALQGHPLTNATVTALYLMALLSGGRTLPKDWKLPLAGLQVAALVTFGGRSAMVASLVLGGSYLLVAAHKVLREGRLTLPGAIIAMALLTLVPLAISGLALGGFFDALLERFVSDGGSANARKQMFDLFGQLPFRDLLVGPDASLVDSIRRMEGLEWGIENPVVRMMLYQGILMTTLMAIAVGLFHWEIAAQGESGLWLPMVCFVLLNQTAESLGSKTTLLSKFIIVIACMYRPVRRPQPAGMARPSAAVMSGSRARLVSSMMPNPSNRFQNAQGRPAASAVSRTSRT